MKALDLCKSLAASIMLAMVFTFISCANNEEEGGNSGGSNNNGGGSCSINGRTVKIGTQTWMAENLNCNVSGSVCYDDNPANCAKYGRLYDWATAMRACPSGWHLPDNEEWLQLIDYVASNSGCCAGKHLKAMSGWSYSNNGENTYGFSAFPSGYVDSNGDFISSYNDYSYWWTSSTNEYDDAYYQYTKNDYTYGGINDKSYSYSVRCLQD